MPQMSACIGSSVFAWASIANVPASQALMIQALSSSRLRMVLYLLRSTGSFRAASARAAASEIGVPLRLAALSCLSAPGLAVAGGLALVKRSPLAPPDLAVAGEGDAVLAPLLFPASAS